MTHIDHDLTPETAPKVAKFINQRTEYVTAARNSVHSDADYHRWQGHMEARRQLAEQLGWTVPYEPGDRTRERTDG